MQTQHAVATATWFVTRACAAALALSACSASHGPASEAQRPQPDAGAVVAGAGRDAPPATQRVPVPPPSGLDAGLGAAGEGSPIPNPPLDPAEYLLSDAEAACLGLDQPICQVCHLRQGFFVLRPLGAPPHPEGTSSPIGRCLPTAADAGAAPNPVALSPELLAIWYFGWSGNNASFFQIGLCADGVATYLFAQSPSDPNPMRLQGRYVARDSSRLTADFQGTARPFMADLSFELEYDAGLDRLHRLDAADGYDAYGRRFSDFSWSEPAATCP